jgi:hypothetical protein
MAWRGGRGPAADLLLAARFRCRGFALSLSELCLELPQPAAQRLVLLDQRQALLFVWLAVSIFERAPDGGGDLAERGRGVQRLDGLDPALAELSRRGRRRGLRRHGVEASLLARPRVGCPLSLFFLSF